MRAHAINLGDLVRAHTVLAPRDAATAQRVAALLGLEIADDTYQPQPEKPSSSANQDNAGTGKPPPPAPFTKKPTDESPAPKEPTLPARLTRLKTRLESERPVWFAQKTFVPVDPGSDAVELVPPSPLLDQRYEATLLADTLADKVPEGAVDIGRLVEMIAHHRSITAVPRLPRPTLRGGALVLMDTSPAMRPFQQDQVALAAAIRQIVGEDLVEVREFTGCPPSAFINDDDETPRPVPLPQPSTAIVLLSDLGIGRPRFEPRTASVRQWQAYLQATRDRGYRVTAFVPYPPDRWPLGLERAARLVCWDRQSPVKPMFRLAASDSAAPEGGLSRIQGAIEELGMLLSLAARVEPALLREVRQTLTPHLDVAAEADFWFSRLVKMRGYQALVLDETKLDALRARLADEPRFEHMEESRFERMRKLLQLFRKRTAAPPILCLEEDIIYHAFDRRVDGTDTIKGLLKNALGTLLAGGKERNDIARWALLALPAMPASIARLREATQLHAAAQILFGRVGGAENDALENESQPWLVPEDMPKETIGIRITATHLHVHAPAADGELRITLPRTHPLLLKVQWPSDPARGRKAVEVWHGGSAQTPRSGTALIDTLDGQRYELRSELAVLPDIANDQPTVFVTAQEWSQLGSMLMPLFQSLEADGRARILTDAAMDSRNAAKLAQGPPATAVRELMTHLEDYRVSFRQPSYHPLAAVLLHLRDAQARRGDKEAMAYIERSEQRVRWNLLALECRAALARIENANELGSGVAIAPDLVLTVGSLFDAAMRRTKTSVPRVRVGFVDERFLYAAPTYNVRTRGNTPPTLDIILEDKEHDIIVPRLDGVIEEGRWLRREQTPPAVATDDVVYLWHHPGGHAAQLSLGHVTSVDHKIGVFYHTAPSAPESAGAPIFNNQWQLVGIHRGHQTSGIETSAATSPKAASALADILNDLSNRAQEDS